MADIDAANSAIHPFWWRVFATAVAAWTYRLMEQASRERWSIVGLDSTSTRRPRPAS
jgi:hypothetical protein